MPLSRRSFVIASALLAVGAAPNRPVIVTIIKTDGTTIRGQLAEINPTEVNVTLLAKPPAQGEAVKVPWSEIKSLSNGMTRARAIDQWKKSHPDDQCETCRGSGKGDCPTCKGTGRDPAAAKACPTCHGEEVVPCKQPKCEAGIIPCPQPCLKLTEGTWVKDDAGLRWRHYASGNGTGKVSEHHLGQIAGYKNGEWITPYDCPVCHKAGKIPCPKCHGTTKAPCATCAAAARANPCPAKCERGQVACRTCVGTGLKSLAVVAPTTPPAANAPAASTPPDAKPPSSAAGAPRP
jgi:hypothetical protein